MGRRSRSFMSEQLKNELAKDLGFYDTVQREGWGGIKAKDAGNMVKRAIQLAEQAAAGQYAQQSVQQAQPNVPQQPLNQQASYPSSTSQYAGNIPYVQQKIQHAGQSELYRQ